MGVLLMAMTIGGVAVAGVLLVTALVTRKPWLATFVLGGVFVWFAFYFLLLVGHSIKSEEKNLALNQPKAFCGFYLDCHMHAAVADVTRTNTIGSQTAKGEFFIVRVNVFSNAERATLGLRGVAAHVVDVDGRAYSRDTEAEASLSPQPEFDQRISPVESFEKQIVFDLPRDVKSPRLDIRADHWIENVLEAVLIDDEDSLLHKRAYFKLDESTTQSAVIR